MEFSILSDIGAKRKANQDYAATFINANGSRLFLLADGMGGHNAGDIASRLAVEDLGKLWIETNFRKDTIPDLVETWLRQHIRYENENIANLGKLDDYAGMGTTLEAVFVGEGFLVSGHIGDSRTYLIRNGEITKLTVDHSLVQELVDAGEITAEEAESHPNKNIITRSLGAKAEAIADVATMPILEGDYCLMNSDGLTNMITVKEILEIVDRDLSMDGKTHDLIALANEHGGLDNITVILLRFERSDIGFADEGLPGGGSF